MEGKTRIIQAPVMDYTPETLPSMAVSSHTSDSSMDSGSSPPPRKILFDKYDIDSGKKQNQSKSPTGLSVSSSESGIYLTSAQMKQLIGILNANPPPPPSPNMHEETTEIMSNLGPSSQSATQMKIESLELECETLKEIVKADSKSILLLKTSLEELRYNGPQADVDLLQEIKELKSERQKLLEKERAYLETIKALKEQVERLSTRDVLESTKQLQQMKLENELFAAQIIENEFELRTVRSSLNELEAENLRMLQEVASLKQDSAENSNRSVLSHPLSKESSIETSTSLEKPADSPSPSNTRVEDLVARLASMEARLADVEGKEESKVRKVDKSNSGGIPRMVTVVNEDEDADHDIEVTLEELGGSVDTGPQRKENEYAGKRRTRESNVNENGHWSLCDCLPRFHEESGEI